jgi:exonuclease III
MRVATWNIKSIRTRVGQVVAGDFNVAPMPAHPSGRASKRSSLSAYVQTRYLIGSRPSGSIG